jgi:ubiquinone/menaquinone biosynthesis C-methylase UbiE
MNTDHEVSGHYASGSLLARLNAMLTEDGVDPNRPSIEALAPYDQFHTRGVEASDHILDIGSGIGGPARYFANRFGCRVTGIDLTSEFCDVARHLTRLLDLGDRITFEVANALAMPFPDGSFDGAYSMNVSMNIADKDAFYREIHRVLKPGGWLALSEIAKGEGGEVDYPTPWANSASTSFLATPEATRSGLQEAGFDVVRLHSTLELARAAGARARGMVERGEKPPFRAVGLIHGALGARATANMGRGISEARLDPIEVLARKQA